MKSLSSKNFFLSLFSSGIILFSGICSSNAQNGKYLRGAVWKKFDVKKEKADFYVSPQGDDTWSGTLPGPNTSHTDGPFRTLVRAQQAVRMLKKKVYKPKVKPVQENYIGSSHPLGSGKDILVLIREGYYSLDKPLVFTPDDGGERVETDQPSGAFEFHKLKDYYVTWAAWPGEHPVISGGKLIRNWKKKGSLWQAPASGIEAEIMVADGRKQVLARTPNKGMYVVAKASPSDHAFFFHNGQVKRWPDMEKNRVIMYLRWHMGTNRISKVEENKHLAMLEKPDAGITVISPRYYIENIRALLDTAGEWYFDEKTDKLLWMLPGNISDPNKAQVALPVLSSLISVEGQADRPVRNLRFYGLILEATKESGNAFSLKYASYCELVDSKIRALGGSGVFLGLGSFETRILDNVFTQIDHHGLVMAGNPYPVRFADIIRQNTISWNRFNDIGERFGNVISVRNTLYTTISHNEISYNKGRYAIYAGGWSNLEEALEGGYVIEYNHLHHVQSRSDDSGVITTGGYTHHSVIRDNLIHDVYKGMFNDNVAIWFDNMSLGWKAENNIFYNLQQGEMKLCASNLTDNIYRNNYHIDPPKVAPEGIITGQPVFEAGNPIVMSGDDTVHNVETGQFVTIRSRVKNRGSSGVKEVILCINGKRKEHKDVAMVRGNTLPVDFDYRFARPGHYLLTVASSDPCYLEVTGAPLSWFCDNLSVSFSILPAGDSLLLTARVSVPGKMSEIPVTVYDNGRAILRKQTALDDRQERKISVKLLLAAGNHSLKIGNSKTVQVYAFPHHKVNIAKMEFGKYCSSRAHPCEITIDKKHNKYVIRAAGTDFFHGEDSYATAYLKKPVKGNFVARVKVLKYGPKTHEWFRTGLFVRNDITRSYDTGKGSLGSVLMFVSPGRAGMDWDEHGDGCMHKASSQNHPVYDPVPMWIKLVRHGNSFSGYVSYDGKHWTVERHTGDIPGIHEAVDLGLAAGGPDEKEYTVWFEDFTLETEE